MFAENNWESDIACWSTTLLLIKRIKTSWRDLTLVMSCSYLISRCRCLFSNGIVRVSGSIRSAQHKTAALNSNNLLIAIVKLAVLISDKLRFYWTQILPYLYTLIDILAIVFSYFYILIVVKLKLTNKELPPAKQCRVFQKKEKKTNSLKTLFLLEWHETCDVRLSLRCVPDLQQIWDMFLI